MKKNKVQDFFTLSFKKFLILIAAEFISIVLHNLLSGLFGTEEAFFFIIAIILLPAYFLVSLLFSLVKKIGRLKKSKKNAPVLERCGM
ncbi:MAG: hypothetical protein ABFQ62_00790 [Patescibacteria group bacterium]